MRRAFVKLVVLAIGVICLLIPHIVFYLFYYTKVVHIVE